MPVNNSFDIFKPNDSATGYTLDTDRLKEILTHLDELVASGTFQTQALEYFSNLENLKEFVSRLIATDAINLIWKDRTIGSIHAFLKYLSTAFAASLNANKNPTDEMVKEIKVQFCEVAKILLRKNSKHSIDKHYTYVCDIFNNMFLVDNPIIELSLTHKKLWLKHPLLIEVQGRTLLSSLELLFHELWLVQSLNITSNDKKEFINWFTVFISAYGPMELIKFGLNPEQFPLKELIFSDTLQTDVLNEALSNDILRNTIQYRILEDLLKSYIFAVAIIAIPEFKAFIKNIYKRRTDLLFQILSDIGRTTRNADVLLELIRYCLNEDGGSSATNPDVWDFLCKNSNVSSFVKRVFLNQPLTIFKDIHDVMQAVNKEWQHPRDGLNLLKYALEHKEGGLIIYCLEDANIAAELTLLLQQDNHIEELLELLRKNTQSQIVQEALANFIISRNIRVNDKIAPLLVGLDSYESRDATFYRLHASDQLAIIFAGINKTDPSEKYTEIKHATDKLHALIERTTDEADVKTLLTVFLDFMTQHSSELGTGFTGFGWLFLDPIEQFIKIHLMKAINKLDKAKDDALVSSVLKAYYAKDFSFLSGQAFSGVIINEFIDLLMSKIAQANRNSQEKISQDVSNNQILFVVNQVLMLGGEREPLSSKLVELLFCYTKALYKEDPKAALKNIGKLLLTQNQRKLGTEVIRRCIKDEDSALANNFAFFEFALSANDANFKQLLIDKCIDQPQLFFTSMIEMSEFLSSNKFFGDSMESPLQILQFAIDNGRIHLVNFCLQDKDIARDFIGVIKPLDRINDILLRELHVTLSSKLPNHIEMQKLLARFIIDNKINLSSAQMHAQASLWFGDLYKDQDGEKLFKALALDICYSIILDNTHFDKHFNYELNFVISNATTFELKVQAILFILNSLYFHTSKSLPEQLLILMESFVEKNIKEVITHSETFKQPDALATLVAVSSSEKYRGFFKNAKLPSQSLVIIVKRAKELIAKDPVKNHKLLCNIISSPLSDYRFLLSNVLRISLDYLPVNTEPLIRIISHPDFLKYADALAIKSIYTSEAARTILLNQYPELREVFEQISADLNLLHHKLNLSDHPVLMSRTIWQAEVLYRTKLYEEHPELRQGNFQSSHIASQKVINDTSAVVAYLQNEQIHTPSKEQALQQIRKIILEQMCPSSVTLDEMSPQQVFIANNRAALIEQGASAEQQEYFMDPDDINHAAWRWLQGFTPDFAETLMSDEELGEFNFDTQAVLTKRAMSDALRYNLALAADPKLSEARKNDLTYNLIMQCFNNQREVAQTGVIEGNRVGVDVSCYAGALGRFIHVYESHPAFSITQQQEVRNQARILLINLIKEQLQETFRLGTTESGKRKAPETIDAKTVRANLLNTFETFTALNTATAYIPIDGKQQIELANSEPLNSEMLQTRNTALTAKYKTVEEFIETIRTIMIAQRETGTRFRGNQQFEDFTEEDKFYMHMLYVAVADPEVKQKSHDEYEKLREELANLVKEAELLAQVNISLNNVLSKSAINPLDEAAFRRAIFSYFDYLMSINVVDNIDVEVDVVKAGFCRKFMPRFEDKDRVEFYAKYKNNPITKDDLQKAFDEVIATHTTSSAHKPSAPKP